MKFLPKTRSKFCSVVVDSPISCSKLDPDNRAQHECSPAEGMESVAERLALRRSAAAIPGVVRTVRALLFDTNSCQIEISGVSPTAGKRMENSAEKTCGNSRVAGRLRECPDQLLTGHFGQESPRWRAT